MFEEEKALLLKQRQDLIAEHSAAIEAMQKEHNKRSATARALITSREDEIAQLQSKVEMLESEIASGAHNEKRIFELAQKQADREATHGRHRL